MAHDAATVSAFDGPRRAVLQVRSAFATSALALVLLSACVPPDPPFVPSTTWASLGVDGGPIPAGAGTPSLDRAGSRVAFTSFDPATRQVMVRDLPNGPTRVVSSGPFGPATPGSDFPDLSGDGTTVVFHSPSSDLAFPDVNGRTDVFAAATAGSSPPELVSVAGLPGSTVQGNGDSFLPATDETGRFVAFETESTNLAPGDSDTKSDVVLRDRVTGLNYWVSAGMGGAAGNGSGAMLQGISADGRYVAFVSDASNLVPGDTNVGSDVFRWDRTTGTTVRVSLADDESELSAVRGTIGVDLISADGRYVAFHAGIALFRRDLQSGSTVRIDGYDDPSAPESGLHPLANGISDDGRYVSYNTLYVVVPPFLLADGPAFVRDTATGDLTAASLSSAGADMTAMRLAWAAAISGDGRSVAFTSMDAGEPGDTNTSPDVYVRRWRP